MIRGILMAGREVTDYIKAMSAKGYSRAAIYSALQQAGWQESDIMDGFSRARMPAYSSLSPNEGNAQSGAAAGQNPTGKKPPVNWPITMLFLLVVLSGIFVLVLEISGFTDFVPGFGPTQPDFQLKAVVDGISRVLPTDLFRV